MAEQNGDNAASTPCLAAAVMSPSTSKSPNNVARMQRNVAEKQRRDKLNGYISELANIVPMVSMSSRRLDKTSILRLSAAHLRICKSSLGGNKSKKSSKWCPNFLSNEQAREILESVDGFLIVTTPNGKVLFTSRSVERYLGHQDIDMIGHSLFMFIHPQDAEAVKVELERLLDVMENSGSGSARRCSFRCRMKEKGQPRSEVVTYQYVHFVGGMSISEEDISGSDNIQRSVVTHMFKAFVKIVDASPYNQLSLEEATADEYVTRHSLDGTIIFADQRLATITGHMPHEVVGLSAYEYIHGEDTSIALFAHHLMFSNDKGTGMIVYRLRTRDDRYVYLKSVGCLQFDGATSQVDHFVCVNQHLNDSEGDKQLKYFIDRYIPHIKGSSSSSLFESVKALQNSNSKSHSVKSKTNGNANSKDAPQSVKKVESFKPKVDVIACVDRNNKPASDTYRDNEHCMIESESEASHPVSFTRSATNNQVKNHSFALQYSSPMVYSDRKLDSSTEFDQGGPESKALTCGTNRILSSTTSNIKYFSPSDNVSGESVADETIYIVSENSSLNVHENAQARAVAFGNSHIVPKGPNNYLLKQRMETESIDVSHGSSFENSPPLSEEDNIPVNDAEFHSEQCSRSIGKNKNGDGRTYDEVGFDDINQAKRENFKGDISIYHPQEKDISSKSDAYFTEANSLYVLQHSRDPLNASKAHIYVEKSFPQYNSLINKDVYDVDQLPEIRSNDSDYTLGNSMWPEGKNTNSEISDLKADMSNSSMDYCDDMETTYDAVSGEMKQALVFQEDLSSLLASTLPHEDSSSSLPSENRWNDIFNPTECTNDDGSMTHHDLS